jgi:tetratricopeptide (TPR) repeat protein
LYGIYQKVEIRRLENQVKNKNFEEAILGYEKIYNNSKTSKIAKANAAYNLMVLNYKNFALKDTYKWSQKALTEMNNKDFLKYKSSFLGVSKYLFERMQFMASGDISHRSLGKICGVKDSLKDTYFLNSVIMYNVSDDHTKLKSLEKLAYQCKLSRNSINEFYKVYLNFLDRTKRYTVLTSYLDKLKNNTGIINDLIFLGGKAYDRSNFNSAKNKWKKFIRYVSGVATAKRILLQLKALDVIAKIELEKLVYVQNQLLNMKLRFPEKTYNSILGNMFVRLEKITDQSIKIQNIGSGDGISKSFDILIGSYQYVFKSINTFKPTNKSNEYIKSFQQSMSKILNPLRSKVIEYQRSFQSTIIKGDILSDVEMKSMDYAVRPVDEIKLISGQRMGKR